MNLKNLAFVALFCGVLPVSFYGCNTRAARPEGAFTVDFHGYTEKPLAEMAEAFHTDKRYVALRAEDQNLMVGEISKVVLRGDKIFVSESFGPRSRNVLVVHDAEGRALAAIGNQGRGPGEYLQISDFDVDAAGCIHLYDGTFGNKAILIYGADGKFIEKKELPFSVDVLKCTRDGGYLFSLSTWDTSEYAGKKFLKTDSSLTVQTVSGEWNVDQVDNNMTMGDGSFISTPDGVFYQRSPDETLFLVDEDGNIEKTWFFDFGSRTFPVESRSNIEPIIMSDKRNSYSWLDYFVAVWGRHIFGVMIDRGEPKSFVYDTETAINYTQGAQDAGDFGAAFTISDGRLVTFFPYADPENLPSGLPEPLVSAVSDGAPLLCLYTLRRTAR